MLPTLLLIRHPLPDSVIGRLFEEAYIKSFRNDFQVVIAEGDCDLDELCDRHQPDLLGYIGAYSPMTYDKRTQLRNAHSHADIPRIGIYLGDGFCTIRPSFFADMERWGVETWFGATHVFLEQTPDVAGRTFGLPHLFDEEIFFDRKLERDIEFAIFGELSAWRRWRKETTEGLQRRFGDAVQLNPHPGYGPDKGVGVLGHNFAAQICRSRFSIADGTIFHYLLRKHLEIPACGALLISEPMPTLEEYGFRDMENCVVGEGDDLLDRLELLRKSPELYAQIAAAGNRLVHERHSARANRILGRWFEAHKALKPGQTLIQHGTFGAFEAVSDGRQGVIPAYTQLPDELAGMTVAAEASYHNGQLDQCLNQINAMLAIKPEYAPARLLMVRLLLRAGRLDLASEEYHGLFLFTWGARYYGGWEPDPVELAWWIMVKLCQRDFNTVNGLLAQYASMRHVELRRVKWLAESLQGRTQPAPAEKLATDRCSVAVHLHSSFTDWLSEALAILNICWSKSMTAQTPIEKAS